MYHKIVKLQVLGAGPEGSGTPLGLCSTIFLGPAIVMQTWMMAFARSSSQVLTSTTWQTSPIRYVYNTFRTEIQFKDKQEAGRNHV